MRVGGRGGSLARIIKSLDIPFSTSPNTDIMSKKELGFLIVLLTCKQKHGVEPEGILIETHA